MTRRTQELWATFAVGFVGVTWGCWWIFLRLIEARGISPGWTLAVVYGAAGILLLPYLAWITFASVLNYYAVILNP